MSEMLAEQVQEEVATLPSPSNPEPASPSFSSSSSTLTLVDECEKNVPPPLDIMTQFVTSMDAGSMCSELAEDCIFNFFGRHVRGVTSIMRYVRSQLLGMFHHHEFHNAQIVSLPHELLLQERFGRSFDAVRRRIYELKERERATTLHLRAESDDEEVPRTYSVGLATPPRPSSHSMSELTFIEACGILKSVSNSRFPGILDLDEVVPLHLTLGYRPTPFVLENRRTIEICLVVYEKYPLKLNRSTLEPLPRAEEIIGIGRQRNNSFACDNPQTDDEGEEVPQAKSRNVRRILFANGSGEEQDEEETGVEEEELNEEDDTSQPALQDQGLQLDEGEPEQQGEEQLQPEPEPKREETEETPSSSTSSTQEEPNEAVENSSICNLTPRKRTQNTNSVCTVEPKRGSLCTPLRTRMRF